jgi:protein-disulfide isomerase
MTQTRSGRSLLCAAALVAATCAAVAAARAFSSPYAPAAPAYRAEGPADAPVTIAEFSDFECPACAAAVEPLKQMRAMYPGKIRLLFKHKPWPFHTWARSAALAAECAGRSGKFWEYHDLLYSHQDQWTRSEDPKPSFLAYAKETGLEPAAFASCQGGAEAAAAVDADLAEASRRWIKSTPTFFINGTRYVGAKQLRTSGLSRVERILGK